MNRRTPKSATLYYDYANSRYVPLDRIIRYQQMQYYADASLCYAQGWAMNYFLLTSPVAKAKGWSGIPSSANPTSSASCWAPRRAGR